MDRLRRKERKKEKKEEKLKGRHGWVLPREKKKKERRRTRSVALRLELFYVVKGEIGLHDLVIHEKSPGQREGRHALRARLVLLTEGEKGQTARHGYCRKKF